MTIAFGGILLILSLQYVREMCHKNVSLDVGFVMERFWACLESKTFAQPIKLLATLEHAWYMKKQKEEKNVVIETDDNILVKIFL